MTIFFRKSVNLQPAAVARLSSLDTRHTGSSYYYYYYYYYFEAHQHKAAGRKTRLDIQNYGCNGNLLCYHGVVERNRISLLLLLLLLFLLNF